MIRLESLAYLSIEKKSFFEMVEGKLMGHIISSLGVKIDFERVEMINKVSLSRHNKDIQSFIGKIKFLKRFIQKFC